MCRYASSPCRSTRWGPALCTWLAAAGRTTALPGYWLLLCPGLQTCWICGLAPFHTPLPTQHPLPTLPPARRQAIGATTPAFTALLGYMIGHQRESRTVYLSLVPVVVGVVIASGAEVRTRGVVGWGQRRAPQPLPCRAAGALDLRSSWPPPPPLPVQPMFNMLGFVAAVTAASARALKSVLQVRWHSCACCCWRSAAWPPMRCKGVQLSLEPTFRQPADAAPLRWPATSLACQPASATVPLPPSCRRASCCPTPTSAWTA